MFSIVFELLLPRTHLSCFLAGGANYLAFVSPVLVGAGSFPFLGAPNRSIFSHAVDMVPELSGYEGTMQALLSVSPISFSGGDEFFLYVF